MGVIFPLTWPGRIVLIIIAIVIGLIWSMLQWPAWWRKVFGKKTEPQQVQEPASMEKRRREERKQ